VSFAGSGLTAESGLIDESENDGVINVAWRVRRVGWRLRYYAKVLNPRAGV